MSSSLLSLAVFLLLSVSLVFAAPTTRQGPTIPNAGGVALSADGTMAFVSTTSTSSAAVYVIPLPITASSNLSPTPYFTNTNSVQYYYIQATASTAPQLIYLLDNQNAQLVSLVYSATSPANSTTLVYNFGIANIDLVDGMYLAQSTGLIYVTLYDHYNGAANDYIGVINPNAATPTLSTFYTTPFVGGLAGILVSSTRLYFGTYTAVIASANATVASIYMVPLSTGGANPTITAGTAPTLMYTTTNANLATTVAGNLIYPSAFQLNAQESILYVSDIGNQNAQAASTPHAIYAIWPLSYSPYVQQLNLSNVYTYTGTNTEVQQNFALSPDQGTVYFAATGNKNGLYITSNANSTIVPQLPPALTTPTAPVPAATSAFAATSAPAAATSAPIAATSAPVAATSAPITATSARAAATSALATSAPVSATSAPVSATSAPVSATSAAIAATSAGGTVPRGPGFLSTGSGFVFSDANDALGCLSSNSNGTVGFAGSDGGDIFVWSLVSVPSTITYTYVAGTGSTGASFIACQADPTGTYLYLLDTRGVLFYRYTVATPTVAPVVVSTFPDEVTGTLTALAIDFVSGFAYIGTRNTDNIYSVPIGTLNQANGAFSANPANSDTVSFALSPDGLTLYYGFPAPAQGVAGGIASLAVQAGTIPYSGSPNTVFQSVSIIYPDSIVVNGTGSGQTLYFKDGGPLHGLAGPTAATTQTISSVNIALATPTVNVLFTSTTVNLPPGLIMTSPVSVARVAPTGVSSLIFTTALTIDFLTLVNSSSTAVTPTAVVATSALLATSAPATSAAVTSPAATSAARVSSSAVSSSAVSSSAVSSSAVSSSAVSSSAVSSSARSSSVVSSSVGSSSVTSAAVTSAPVTSAAATSAPATSAAVTSAAATSAPATSAAVTSAGVTSAAATSARVSSSAVTSAAATSAPVTSAAATSAAVTSAVATSALRASSSVTSAVAPTSAAVGPNTGNGQGGTTGTAGTAVSAGTGGTSPSRVVGDPMFVGFLRQRYQVHGMDGVVYNILSQASVSINALFVFLESGSCPVVEGVVATNCWSHPGSYFGSLSMQTSAGDQLEIVAGGATTGFSAVRFDGETVRTVKGVEGKGAKLSFQMLSTHSMAITIDNYRLVIENSDLFVNLVSIEVLDWQQMASIDQPHGLLGQTWKPSKKARGGAVVAVHDVAEGDVDDYVIASDSVFGTDFLYNKFAKEQ